MHFTTLVLVHLPGQDLTKRDAVEKAVGAVLADGEGDWWDWWRIGGRWTGLFDGYDPYTDPANQEVCDLCEGTGDRKDLGPPEWKAEMKGCNGCHGTGITVKWPTQYGPHLGDMMPATALTAAQLEKFYHIAVEGEGHWESERFLYQPWGKSKWVETPEEMPPLSWLHQVGRERNLVAVVVDVHN